MKRLQKEVIPMTCTYLTNGICNSFPLSKNVFKKISFMSNWEGF